MTFHHPTNTLGLQLVGLLDVRHLQFYTNFDFVDSPFAESAGGKQQRSTLSEYSERFDHVGRGEVKLVTKKSFWLFESS